MRLCPVCEQELPDDAYRYGLRPCIECTRAKGRERERLRRQRDGDKIRAADRARTRPPEQEERRRARQRANAERKRRAAGMPVRRKGSDPAKVEAQRLRNNAARRVPPELRKHPLPYESFEAKRAAYNARRRERGRSEREKERHRQRQKAKRLADPEGVRAREREKARQWYRTNADKARAKANRDSAVRNARKRGAEVREFTARDRGRIEARQRGCCAYCGERQPLTLDHVIPLCRGGRHAVGNLVLACETCNKSKGARLLVEWRLRSRHGRVAA